MGSALARWRYISSTARQSAISLIGFRLGRSSGHCLAQFARRKDRAVDVLFMFLRRELKLMKRVLLRISWLPIVAKWPPTAHYVTCITMATAGRSEKARAVLGTECSLRLNRHKQIARRMAIRMMMDICCLLGCWKRGNKHFFRAA